MSLLILSFFYLRPVIIGLTVREQLQEFTQPLNLKFNESIDYEWQLEHTGKLQSVKISGLIEEEKNGKVKVYLDDSLILDSSKLESKKAKLTGAITGLAAEGIEETTGAQAPAQVESYSEEIKEEAPLGKDLFV